MKTQLKVLSLVFALGFPTALLAQFAGASIPAAFDGGHLFSAFALSLTLLIVLSDYSTKRSSLPRLARRQTESAKVVPFAAPAVQPRLAA
jgi:hypothetical protein